MAADAVERLDEGSGRPGLAEVEASRDDGRAEQRKLGLQRRPDGTGEPRRGLPF
jgi:hypothetical protein